MEKLLYFPTVDYYTWSSILETRYTRWTIIEDSLLTTHFRHFQNKTNVKETFVLF